MNYIAAVIGCSLVSIASSIMAQTISINGHPMRVMLTNSGCKYYAVSLPRVLADNEPKSLAWSGRCLNGFIEGPGKLSGIVYYEGKPFKTGILAGNYRQGLAVGFSLETSIYHFNDNKEEHLWGYAYNGDNVYGWGYGSSLNFDPLKNLGDVTFTPPSAPPGEYSGINALSGLTANVFITMKCVSQCQSKFVGIETTTKATVKERYSIDYDPTSPFFKVCPHSPEFRGCADLAWEEAAPVRKEIQDFIRATRPQVEKILADSQRDLAQAQ